MRQAAAAGADIALLPERWEAFGSADELRAAAEPLDGPRLAAVQGWARELGMAIVAGSVAERVAGDERLRNTSVAFDRDGRQVAAYRKIHQFDVDLPGQRVRESDTDAPGTGGVIAALDGVSVGLTICYDLRFPELYRAYARGRRHGDHRARGVPRAHRPRSLGGAAARARDREPVLRRGRQPVRHGCPRASRPTGARWSSIRGAPCIAQAPDGHGVIVADCDHDALARVRAQVPSLAHRRPEAYDQPT